MACSSAACVVESHKLVAPRFPVPPLPACLSLLLIYLKLNGVIVRRSQAVGTALCSLFSAGQDILL